jgi:hypothetical protein
MLFVLTGVVSAHHVLDLVTCLRIPDGLERSLQLYGLRVSLLQRGSIDDQDGICQKSRSTSRVYIAYINKLVFFVILRHEGSALYIDTLEQILPIVRMTNTERFFASIWGNSADDIREGEVK